MPLIVAPSLLAADHGRLNDEIQKVATAGADWIHLDVMDGHFVPNLTFGPPLIKNMRRATTLPFDVHLMIEKPALSVAQYVDAGANLCTVHVEACVHLHRTLALIRDLGARPGVALNPATPVQAIEHVLHMVDLVLVMSVNPGFGGQAFIPEVLPKIEALRILAQQRGLDFRIQVDGGITPDTVAHVSAAGADAFVAGSAVFHREDYGASIAAIRQRAWAAQRQTTVGTQETGGVP